MMQLQCFGDMDWETLWVIQAFMVPLFHLVVSFAQISISFALQWLTDRGCTSWLLRLGWRPRRDFSLESLVFSFAPTYMSVRWV